MTYVPYVPPLLIHILSQVTVNDDSSVQILAEEAHPLENFDSSSANEALKEAESKLNSAKSEQEKAEAQIAVEAGQAIVAAIHG